MHLFTFLCVGGLLALVNQAHAGGDDLAKAVKGLTEASSYRFTQQDGMVKSAVEVKYQKDSPLYCKADGIEFFRKADVLVYKQGDTWQRTRTGTLSDPLRILAASAKVRAVRLPHEELAVVGAALTNIKKTATKGEILLSGDLGEEAAKKLARTEDRGNARSGAAKLWLDAEGRLTKYEIAIRILGKRGNAEVDGTVTKTVTLAGVGATKLEVPAAVKKALE